MFGEREFVCVNGGKFLASCVWVEKEFVCTVLFWHKFRGYITD